MNTRRILASALILVAAVSARAAAPDRPADYAVRVPVRPVPGASFQRIDVPARILAASREAGLADVRLFDARDRPLPFARSARSAPRSERTVRLAPLPILGAADALTATGVSLTIDSRQAGVVRVQGLPAGTTETQLLGVLLDTRGLADPAGRLRLEAEIPRGRPIAFSIASGADLRTWEPLAETTLYDAAGGAVAGIVDLPAAALAGRYLRVTWSPSAGSIAVRGASVTTTHAPDPAQWPRAVIRPATIDARTIAFTLPFATPLAALEIAAAPGADSVIPIRILGRNEVEQPWTPIADGSVFRLTRGGTIRRNPPFDLAGTTFRSLRIEADARSPGFAAPPAIAVRFAPARLLFLAGGPPPFTLAAGRAGARAVDLPARSLIPGYDGAVEAGLPAATAPVAADPVIEAADEAAPKRALLLWGVLIAATALLGAMVWRLARDRSPAA